MMLFNIFSCFLAWFFFLILQPANRAEQVAFDRLEAGCTRWRNRNIICVGTLRSGNPIVEHRFSLDCVRKTAEITSFMVIDFDQHWKSCAACEETVEAAAHTLDEFGVRSVCGAQPIDWGESRTLLQFNENGDPLKSTDYDAEGNLIAETIYATVTTENSPTTYPATVTEYTEDGGNAIS